MFCDINEKIKEKWITKLAHLYSIHTAEIDDILPFGQEDKILVWKVMDAKVHPNSDHLNVVQVYLGEKLWQRQIVCWADNVREAKYVAVSIEWAVVKWMTIAKTNLRWEESNGMICSADELDLQEERDWNIIKLEDHFDVNLLETKLGTPFYELEVEILGNNWEIYKSTLKDTTFEIDNKFITNRPDLFWVIWNAREFGAVFDLDFKAYSSKNKEKIESQIKGASKINVEVTSPNVLSYNLYWVKDIATKQSPLWISQMLYKAWINPKYDIVDLTNWILTEIGQPTHAFDADKIEWKITIRQAKNWEIFNALNGKEYTLEESDIVIADDKKILALAWIMWWAESAISEESKNIYFEIAIFDAVTVRLTSSRLWLRTDASARYEKSLDVMMRESSICRIYDILEYLGKNPTISGQFEFTDEKRINKIEIAINYETINTNLGKVIEKSRVKTILEKLGFVIKSETAEWLVVLVPSWRATKDVSIKEDLVEEIWRVYGYENIEWTPIFGNFEALPKNIDIELKDKINNYFSSNGFFEVYNYSFSWEDIDAKLLYSNNDNAVRILNACNVDLSLMRRSMFSSLIPNVVENKKIEENFAFFEIGKIFEKIGENKFTETRKIAWFGYWKDFSFVKWSIFGLLNSLLPDEQIDIIQWLNDQFFHPNKSWVITVNWVEIAKIWYLTPEIASNFDIEDGKTIIFEIDFETLKKFYLSNEKLFKEFSRFPGITRDLNFVLDEKKPVWEIINLIKFQSNLIKNVWVADIYINAEKIWEDKKSVTFNFLIQDDTKTITDKEALDLQEQIIANLEKEWIKLRW